MDGVQNHSEGDHFLVLENGRFAYVSLPPKFSTMVTDEAQLCFTDHQQTWDPTSDTCCLQESGHVHAHVHHGEIIEDVLLEQCMEEAGCTLPMFRDLTGICNLVSSHEESGHDHMDGCAHDQIAHGDHFDCLVPLNDGSFLLSHAEGTGGGISGFIEHGRLVKVGKPLGKLQQQPRQFVDLFSYESPRRKGYESLPQTDNVPEIDGPDIVKGAKLQLDRDHTFFPSLSIGRNVVQEDMVKVTVPENFKGSGLGKTTFDVMGICCPSEVILIKRMLEPIPGVEEVSVNVTAKTVTVLHDKLWVTDGQLVKVLNEANLDASIHHRGEWKAGRKWPSPWTIASGVLLALAFFQYLWHPLRWVAIGSVAVGIPPLIVRGVASLRRYVLDINILMLIAVGGAIGLGDYLEAGSIVFLFTLADWLESRSGDKARAALASVVDLAPQTAVLSEGGCRVRVEDVKVGSLLAVKAGEIIPIDGEVVSGKSSVDESSVTGESMPVEKEVGATVWAGTLNMSGFMTVSTTALSEDSAVSRMVRLVEEAQNQRSSTEMLVEKIAKYYTPAIVLAALAIGVIPWAAGVHNHRHWIYLALVLLIVACPCALVISTPVVVTCGIAQAARLGLLIKGGSYLEVLGKLKVVALDKTGTLSEGQFRVLDIVSVDANCSVQQILYWVASVENQASHPLAAALVNYARLHGVEPSDDVTEFELIVGEGVSGIVNGRTIHIGNARMAARHGWDIGLVEMWNSEGAMVGWIGVDKIAVGIYSVGDQLRLEAVEAVKDLQKLGIRVAMLTGDSSATAEHAHKKLGNIEVHAQLLPEDKVHIVRNLKATGVTAMVGDGINDGPALAAADVGIAMGVAGSAVAMETADVALMTNDLRKLALAVQLGQNCRWKIGQNVALSFVTKLTIIAVAAAGYATLWAAVVADVGTCLVVIFNSMRLLKERKKTPHCCSKQKMVSKKHLHSRSGLACCLKSGEDTKCLEGELDEVCEETPVVPHSHTGKFPWFHNHHHHHHHHHHHPKKHEDETQASCCHKTTVESKHTSAPCCSSARSEQVTLTPRVKVHRHGHQSHQQEEMSASEAGCCVKSGLEIKAKGTRSCSSTVARSAVCVTASSCNSKDLQGQVGYHAPCSLDGLHAVNGPEQEGSVAACCEKSVFGKGIRRRVKETCSSERGNTSGHHVEESCLPACSSGCTDPQVHSLGGSDKAIGLKTDVEPCSIEGCGKAPANSNLSCCGAAAECCARDSSKENNPHVNKTVTSLEAGTNCCLQVTCNNSNSSAVCDGLEMTSFSAIPHEPCANKCKAVLCSARALCEKPKSSETPASSGSSSSSSSLGAQSLTSLTASQAGGLMCCADQSSCKSCAPSA